MSKQKVKKRRAAPPAIARRQQEPDREPTASEPGAEAPAEPAASAPKKRGQYQAAADVVDKDTQVYAFWKQWMLARQRGDYPLIYELSEDDSPLRAHFGPREEFAELCRRKMRPVRGTSDLELIRIGLVSDVEARIVASFGHRERDRRVYELELWTLKKGELGWRVHQIDALTVPKERAPKSVPISEFAGP